MISHFYAVLTQFEILFKNYKIYLLWENIFEREMWKMRRRSTFWRWFPISASSSLNLRFYSRFKNYKIYLLWEKCGRRDDSHFCVFLIIQDDFSHFCVAVIILDDSHFCVVLSHNLRFYSRIIKYIYFEKIYLMKKWKMRWFFIFLCRRHNSRWFTFLCRSHNLRFYSRFKIYKIYLLWEKCED